MLELQSKVRAWGICGDSLLRKGNPPSQLSAAEVEETLARRPRPQPCGFPQPNLSPPERPLARVEGWIWAFPA